MAWKRHAFGLRPLTKQKATFELIFAGALWGFGFVAAVWALQAFTPVETLVLRFIIASAFGEIIYLLIKGPKFSSLRSEMLQALPAGLLLGSMLLLQTIGLQYTSATKSGFITSLYVILVPLLNSWFFRTSSDWRNYALAFVALGGTLLLIDGSLSDINQGDIWTLACSVAAAFHIIYIGRISKKVGNAFRFNNFQSIWCLLVLLPLLLTQDKVQLTSSEWKPWLGILALGLGSSLIAFYLQIRSQRILSDATASMLFLLESPFAAFFGYLLLNENLNTWQTSGAGIILISSILQVLWDPSLQTKETKQ